MKTEGSVYDRELAEILANPEFGIDEDARRRHLRAAKLSAMILTWLSIPAFFFAAYFSDSYRLVSMLVMLSMPWIGLLLFLKFPVLRMFHTSKSQRYAYPNLDLPFIMSAGGVVFASSSFGHLISPAAAVAAAIFSGVLIGVTFISLIPLVRQNPGLWFFFMIFGIFYGGGTLVFGNAYFDQSKATPHWSKVVGKHVSHGSRSIIYDLDLSPWLDREETESVSVSSSFYQAKTVGDPIEVLTRPGLFKIEWYTLQFEYTPSI